MARCESLYTRAASRTRSRWRSRSPRRSSACSGWCGFCGPRWSTASPRSTRAVHRDDAAARRRGGLLNAFFGSAIMSLLGVLIGTPIGLVAGTYLAEYANTQLSATRSASSTTSCCRRRRSCSACSSTPWSSHPAGPLLRLRRRARAGADRDCRSSCAPPMKCCAWCRAPCAKPRCRSACRSGS